MSSGRRHPQGYSARQAVAALAPAALAVLALSVAAGPTETAFAGACANADATNEASGKVLRKALTCLINSDRAERDRHVLDPNRALKQAATKHNETMIEDDCWKHHCPGEPTLGNRLQNSGYLDGARRWRYAENFGCSKTPQGMLNVWLDNDFARENIRNKAYRDIGVGVLKDQVGASGCDDGDEVTYTVVLARRKG